MLYTSFPRLRSAASVVSTFKPTNTQKSRAATLLFLSAIGAGISMGLITNANAGNYSQMVFFGDSLTDTGFFKGVGQEPSFTTNPDPVWAQLLAREYGLKADPAYALTFAGPKPLGGTNYAVGGARVSTRGSYSLAFVPTTTEQVQAYIAANKGKLDNKGLFSLWAGANDVFAYTQENAAGLINPATQAATAQKIIGLVAGEAVNVVGLLGQLQQAGANTVMVVNLPNIGNTPEAAGAGLKPLWTGAAYTFNQTLNQGLNKLGGNVVALDAFSLLDEVIANPMKYGFKNAISPACTSVVLTTGKIYSAYCNANTLVEPGANLSYVFADSVHPTGGAHAMLAQYTQSVLRAPSQIGMLAEAPLAGAMTVARVVDNRFRLNAKALTAGKSEAYAVYENSQIRLDQKDNTQGVDGSANSMTVGIDHAINQHVLIGGLLVSIKNKTKFGNNTGDFRLDQAMMSAYAQYRDGPWAVNALGLLSTLDYKVTRSMMLGAARRNEDGNTGGAQKMLRIGGQYDFGFGVMTVSPVANLTWQQVTVNGYDEMGNDSTAMHFDQQTRNSLVSSLGAQLTSTRNWGGYTVLPFVKLAWEKELKNNPREVRTHVVSMGGSFGAPVYQGADNTMRLDAGANVVLAADFNAFAAYGLQYASGNSISSFQLGLKKAF